MSISTQCILDYTAVMFSTKQMHWYAPLSGCNSAHVQTLQTEASSCPIFNQQAGNWQARRDCLGLYTELCLRVNKAWDWAVPVRCTFSACRPFVLEPFVEPVPNSLKLPQCWVSWRSCLFTHTCTHSHVHTLILSSAHTHIKAQALQAFRGII